MKNTSKDTMSVSKVLKNLLATPAANMPTDYTASLKVMLSCGLEWVEKVSDEEFGKYTYLDLICLSRIAAEKLVNEDPGASPSLMLLSENIFLNFLQKTEKNYAWTDRFGAVNLRELLDLLDDRTGLPRTSFDKLMKLTGEIHEDSIFKYNITPRSTVKDLLDQTDSVIKQFWRPWHDLRHFTSNVMTGYKVITLITFDCIPAAFREIYDYWKAKNDKMTNG